MCSVVCTVCLSVWFLVVSCLNCLYYCSVLLFSTCGVSAWVFKLDFYFYFFIIARVSVFTCFFFFFFLNYVKHSRFRIILLLLLLSYVAATDIISLAVTLTGKSFAAAKSDPL